MKIKLLLFLSALVLVSCGKEEPELSINQKIEIKSIYYELGDKSVTNSGVEKYSTVSAKLICNVATFSDLKSGFKFEIANEKVKSLISGEDFWSDADCKINIEPTTSKFNNPDNLLYGQSLVFYVEDNIVKFFDFDLNSLHYYTPNEFDDLYIEGFQAEDDLDKICEIDNNAKFKLSGSLFYDDQYQLEQTGGMILNVRLYMKESLSESEILSLLNS